MILFYITTDFNWCGCKDYYRGLFENEEAACAWADEKAWANKTGYDIDDEDEDGDTEDIFVDVEEYNADDHDDKFSKPYETEEDIKLN